MSKRLSACLLFIVACECGGSLPLPRDGGRGDLNLDASNRCMPGQTTCAGNAFFTCAEDGVTRLNEMQCEDACDPSSGCVTCVPGSRRCSGDISELCTTDGFIAFRDCSESETTCTNAGYCDDACGNAALNNSYIGCEYWASPLPNLDFLETRGFDFRIVIANPNSEPAFVKVLSGVTVVESATVAPGELQSLVLPWISGFSDFSDVAGDARASLITQNAAYRVVSDLPVTLTQFNPFEYEKDDAFSVSNDASLLLPVHSLTSDYVVASWTPQSTTSTAVGGQPIQHYPSYAAVVGITDAPTVVTITATAPIAATVDGRLQDIESGTTGTFTLTKGEVAVLMNQAPPTCVAGRPGFEQTSVETFCEETEFDISGSRIASTNPIAVFGGHACALVPYQKGACDHLESQLPPLQTWGTEYVAIKMVDTEEVGFNIIRITGGFDGTQVTLNPAQDGRSALTLADGQTREYRVASDHSITATEGVMVSQFLGGQGATCETGDSSCQSKRGDPAMVILVPQEQFRQDYTFVAPASYNAATNGQSFIAISRRPGAALNLDGSAVADSEFRTVGAWQTAVIPIQGGTHTITGSDSFGSIVFGMGRFTSYAYPAGLDLEQILLL